MGRCDPQERFVILAADGSSAFNYRVFSEYSG